MPQTQDTDENVEPVDSFAPMTADRHLSVAERTAPVIDGPIATDHRSIWPLSPARMTAVVAALITAAICGPAAADPTTGINGADLGVLLSLATFVAAFLIPLPKKDDQS
ncbi:hypothetical protein E0W80_04335 [Microbacterium sp. PI-1]|uniref:hypothetical protein n=1 Tax=Microbacterium sp. PI-1 TaxID=2545631 RepID=UPI00103F1AC7|nr:hypothetical protein [Microbacterium sp. PI-1]TCJ28733.1 hypothetical protein E0W80_04335 [Microbacterium sp. PI-1]